MDGRGGCCIARYSTGGVYGSPYDMSKVDRIMLRFRPIAPKPVAGGEVSGAGDEIVGIVKRKKKSETRTRAGGRGKRRHCNDSPNPKPSKHKRCNYKKRKSSSSSSSSRSTDRDEDRTVVTLPLLPESPEPKVFAKERNNSLSPTWLSFEENYQKKNNNFVPSINPGGRLADHPTVGVGGWRGGRVVGSSVTVECVTDTWTDGYGLGRTDDERRANLERDTCPGFVSDGFGRVTWTNGAYRSMVMGPGCGEEGDVITVWLVMKERLPAEATLTYPAFTCRVSLQCHVDGQDFMKKTLPCDVWRLDGGGFAWRLDIKAALCLGR